VTLEDETARVAGRNDLAAFLLNLADSLQDSYVDAVDAQFWSANALYCGSSSYACNSGS